MQDLDNQIILYKSKRYGANITLRGKCVTINVHINIEEWIPLFSKKYKHPVRPFTLLTEISHCRYLVHFIKKPKTQDRRLR